MKIEKQQLHLTSIQSLIDYVCFAFILAEIHLVLLDAEFKLKENVLERETLSDIRTECF